MIIILGGFPEVCLGYHKGWKGWFCRLGKNHRPVSLRLAACWSPLILLLKLTHKIIHRKHLNGRAREKEKGNSCPLLLRAIKPNKLHPLRVWWLYADTTNFQPLDNPEAKDRLQTGCWTNRKDIWGSNLWTCEVPGFCLKGSVKYQPSIIHNEHYLSQLGFFKVNSQPTYFIVPELMCTPLYLKNKNITSTRSFRWKFRPDV